MNENIVLEEGDYLFVNSVGDPGYEDCAYVGRVEVVDPIRFAGCILARCLENYGDIVATDVLELHDHEWVRI